MIIYLFHLFVTTTGVHERRRLFMNTDFRKSIISYENLLKRKMTSVDVRVCRHFVIVIHETFATDQVDTLFTSLRCLRTVGESPWDLKTVLEGRDLEGDDDTLPYCQHTPMATYHWDFVSLLTQIPFFSGKASSQRMSLGLFVLRLKSLKT